MGGDLDRTWTNLIIDSKDNLYANDGKLIFKFGFEGGTSMLAVDSRSCLTRKQKIVA